MDSRIHRQVSFGGFELFPWYRNNKYRGFFYWLFLNVNWYPAIGNTPVTQWKYNRYMGLCKLLIKR